MSPDIEPSNTPLPADKPTSVRVPNRLNWVPCWVPGWRTLVSAALGVAYPFLVFWVLGTQHSLSGLVPAMLFLPPVCVNLGLAWFFGRTLAPGREALITRFARLERREPEPRILIYTRRLTWVWVVFFLFMAAVSVALAASGAREAWVWFTAVGNYLCVAALFAIEYGYRRWRFPRNDHVSPRQQLLMMRAALRNQRR
jgi:hypothetical protein